MNWIKKEKKKRKKREEKCGNKSSFVFIPDSPSTSLLPFTFLGILQ
jgi:hypothetical protein